MELIADILLITGALGAGFYCHVLSRRLKRFNSLENGVGGAVAVLSAQVDDLQKSLTSAQATAATSANTLTDLTAKAEDMAKRLELQMASMHDIPQTPQAQASQTTPEAPASNKEPAPVVPDKPPAIGEPMFIRHSAQGAVQ